MNSNKFAFNFVVLILAAIWLLGGIGGTAYLFYYGETFFAIMNILMSGIAGLQIVPLIKEALRG